ncbi:Reverse transcriptase zinc-binding domain [Arabidopsis suecica]|uniref:Reverse transcriptase zinc-binding domain n=1 Tax=Arabidopsis suecica TaxID=45249 RepID=A0A8T2C009_ARASU|nr:Reverse transcriptase zinc-binding domain [Arabidopsis suecica]
MGRLIDLVGETGICSLGVQRYAKVADAIMGSNWCLRRCRDRNLNEIKQYIYGLMIPNSEAGKDVVLWRHTAEEYRPSFSSSRTWDQLRTRSDAKTWSKVIWFPQAVPRFALISWLAIKDRLSTGERTSHWGHVQPCLFCGEPVESRDHLYFACPYSFLVWLEVVGSLLHAPDPDWSATLGCLSTSSMDGNTSILLRLAFQATLYYLWRERNDRKHNQRYRSNTQLAATIEKAIKARIMSLRYYETPKLRNLLQVWFGSRRS